jgi:hypothetical protein
MRKVFIFMTIAILAVGASPVLAITLQNTFTVSGHLGVTTSTGKCTSLAYPASVRPPTLASAIQPRRPRFTPQKGKILTIPPGTTQVAVSVDLTDKASSPGCKPAWGEVQYNQTGGGDSATIEFFASLCPALAATAPLTFSGAAP